MSRKYGIMSDQLIWSSGKPIESLLPCASKCKIGYISSDKQRNAIFLNRSRHSFDEEILCNSTLGIEIELFKSRSSFLIHVPDLLSDGFKASMTINRLFLKLAVEVNTPDIGATESDEEIIFVFFHLTTKELGRAQSTLRPSQGPCILPPLAL